MLYYFTYDISIKQKGRCDYYDSKNFAGLFSIFIKFTKITFIVLPLLLKIIISLITMKLQYSKNHERIGNKMSK